MTRTRLSYTFAVIFCMSWILLNCVASEHSQIPGAFYTREDLFANQLPSLAKKNIIQNLPLCSALCQSESCNGFFYSNTTNICVIIHDDISSHQMMSMPNVFYYRRQDSTNYTHSVTLSVKNSLTIQTTYSSFPFTRDLKHDELLANDVTPKGATGNTPGDCATSCTDAECVGFFYDMKNGVCFPVKKHFLTSFSHVANMTYYKRQVYTNSKLVSLDFNICPSFQRGDVVINMFNGESYRIFVDPDQVNQSVAANRCNQRQQELLRMKDKMQFEYIQQLLSCQEFAGKEIWVGAEKNGTDWKFPDQSGLDPSYFCSYAPNEPTQQFCVGFLNGCLNDNQCENLAGFMCE